MRFRPRSFFTLIIIVLLGFGIIDALSWPLRASILVLTIGTLIWVLSVVQLFIELRPSHEAVASGMDIELTDDQELAKNPLRALNIWLWLIAFVVGVWLLGMMITVPLWTFLYSFRHGSRWWLAVILAVICFAFLEGFLDQVLHVPFPEPAVPVEQWIRNAIAMATPGQ